MWPELLQNLVSEFLGWLLLPSISAGGLAGLVALLKAKYPRLAAVILYRLATGASVMVILVAAKGYSLLSKQPPQTTPETVDTSIKTWIDNARLKIQRKNGPGSYFVFVITLPNGIEVDVTRRKVREVEHYLLTFPFVIRSG